MIRIGYITNSKECWLRTGVNYLYKLKTKITIVFFFFNLKQIDNSVINYQLKKNSLK